MPPLSDPERAELNFHREGVIHVRATYERPTLTPVGSFQTTGLGLARGPEKVLILRFSL